MLWYYCNTKAATIYIKNRTRIYKEPIKRIVKRIYINKVAILIHQRIFILSVNNRLNKKSKYQSTNIKE